MAALLVLALPRLGLPQERDPNATNRAAVQETASTEGVAPTTAPKKDTAEDAKSAKPGPKSNQSEYVRCAVRLIAVLLAFLTVVGVWKIPPSQTRLTAPQAAAPPQTGGTKGETDNSPKEASPFASNFGRTVIAGLGGIAGISILGDVFKADDGFNVKPYYICWFVASFFSLLVLSSLLRAWTESLRGRIAEVGEPPLSGSGSSSSSGEPQPEKPGNGAGMQEGPNDHAPKATGEADAAAKKEDSADSDEVRKKRGKLREERRRRRSRLIFLDTLFNVIQGNNQLQTAVLGDTILDLQQSLLSAADRARTNIQRSVRRALEGRKKEVLDDDGLKATKLGDLKHLDIDDQSVRVGISILSPDEASLSYIVSGPGSLPHYFDRRSVAWVSVYSGEARWWKLCYKKNEGEIELFNNTGGALPVEKERLILGRYFQERATLDYEAFLVLPVPWSRRSEVRYRKAGIHISFSHEVFLDALIDGSLEADTFPATSAPYEPKNPLYKSWKTLLGGDDPKQQPIPIKDPTLRAVLLQAIDLLGEVLRHYNEEVLQLGGPRAQGG